MTVKSILATLTIIVVALSCTVIEEQENILLPGADDSEYTSVSMILPQVEILEEDPLTKMTVNVQSNPVAYLWAEKDTVGIFPDKGSQIYFSMADGVGTSKVSFDGGGWALKKNSSYYSYFPFVPDFYIRKDAIPINFEGQSQLGNADPSVADVGRYCYMAAKGDSDPDTGNLTFKYERLGVISRFQIPVDPGTYTSLTIKPGSSVLAYKGTYNATEIDQIIYEPTYSDELSLALEEVTFTEPAVLVAFMMLPPFDIKGKQLTVELTKSDGTVVTSSAFGKNYALGTAQGSSMNFSVYGRNASIDGIDGTQVVITGSTTRPHSYTVSTDVDWLTLGSYPTSGSAVINVTAAKGTGTARFGHVIVSEQVTSGGTTITLQNKVKITQDSKGMGVGLYADLSAEGTANSYIVSQAGDYKFGAVKGNSSEPVGAVASAEVLWESFGTATAPSEGDLVKEVSYSDGYIHFSTADKYNEGNAVIAAKNSSGEILWSWHIWLTDAPEGQVYYNGAGTMMDRNLGATSATPGDVGALGLLYQWGRKDPFLGSLSISSDIEAKSTVTWPSVISSDSSTGTIEYATANPTTFITYNESNYDWYYTGSSSTDDTRWTTSGCSKSIYDPCPSGWRVPDGGDNGVWSKALGSSSYYDDTYDSTNDGMNFSGKFGSASTIWYPASGYRRYNYGSLNYVGHNGLYWSASPNNRNAYDLDFTYNGFVYPSFNYGRAFGFSVRCVKEGSTSPTPSEPEIINLSNKGLANSYIVSEAGSYKIVPTKGNSNESVGTISSVEVLWESFGTDVTPNVGDLVKNVKYADGAISFDTPSTFKEGNAVIAAKNSSDEILWSWHIWLTDEPQGQEYYNNAGTMMDRNLGATSATPGDVGALGLLYQWGRKDPFLGSSSISSDIEAKSTVTWPSVISSDSSTGTIEYATANPTTFITYNESNYDWYYTGSGSTDNTRWTTSESSKSIYDPCPSGWRVPDGGSNGVWSTALGSYSSYNGTYDSTNEGMNFSGMFGSASTIWYPSSGYRSISDGSPYSVGYEGDYWSASPLNNFAYILGFSNAGDVHLSVRGSRANGRSVRCLQE